MKAQQGSLVAQWEGVCQTMRETQVRSLAQEDLTRLRPAKPLRHNYRVCPLEPKSCNN